MEPARAADLVELAAQFRHAVADQPAVGLDLGLAGAAEKAEAAALALQVGPAAHQPAGLIIEMRQLHLQPPLGGGSALPENFQDQPGAVDHLGFQRGFQIALLNRSQARVEHDELCVLHPRGGGDGVNLPLPDQRGRARVAQPHRQPISHIQPDRHRQPGGFRQPCLAVARMAALIGQHDDRPGAAGKFAPVAVKTRAQSSTASSARLSGCAG